MLYIFSIETFRMWRIVQGVKRLHVVPAGMYAFTLDLNKHLKTNIPELVQHFQHLGYPVSNSSYICLCSVDTASISYIFH